jgi:hypothetical protein
MKFSNRLVPATLFVLASKKGQQLQIPSEALLEFRLQQPVSLPVGSKSDHKRRLCH